MQKKVLFPILMLAFVFIALKPHGNDKNSSQAPLGRTGAPGETTCGSCHSGGSYSGSTTFTLGSENASEYTPGATYVISFAAEYSAPRYGFSITALDASDNPAGSFTLINTDNTSTGSLGNGRQYVGHRSASANNTWTYQWTAPSQEVGTITFYYAVLAANANGNTSGDIVFTGSANISPAQPAPTFSLSLVSVPANGGVLTGQGDYEEGETISVTATTNPGYQFINWTDAGNNEVSSQQNFNYMMPAADVSLFANFSFTAYTVSFMVEDESGSPIADATITLDGETNDAGVYVFGDIPPGSYNYSVSKEGYFDKNGTVTVADADVSVTVVLSIDDTHIAELHGKPMVSIYPNPSSTLITLQSGGNAMQEVMIFDLKGKRVHHTLVSTHEHQIDISALEPAIYLVQIRLADALHIQRIVVQH